jgi:tetratricopeptide (TPR) repeat protein
MSPTASFRRRLLRETRWGGEVSRRADRNDREAQIERRLQQSVVATGPLQSRLPVAAATGHFGRSGWCWRGRVLVTLVILVIIGSEEASAAAAPEKTLPRDEAAILAEIEQGPAPHLYAELAEWRGREAAVRYEQWRETGRSDDLQQAIHYAASAVDLRPDWDLPRVLLGMIYAQFTGDRETLELATEVLIEAVDLNPANGPAQLLLAQVLMQQGRFWSAIEQFESLFAKSPAMITPINTAPMALCYVLDGRILAGIRYFDQLAAAHPRQPAVVTALAVLLRQGGEGARAKALMGELAAAASVGPEMRRHAADLLAAWEQEDRE